MIRKAIAVAATLVFVLGLSCSGSNGPVAPGKDIQSDIDAFFSQYPAGGMVIGEFTARDFNGNVISTGKIAKDAEGNPYVLESRGLEGIPVDFTGLHLIFAFVTYLDPRGTIETGPYSGYPYYYIGDCFDYEIHLLSFADFLIGGVGDGPGYSGPAELQAEMHYAAITPDGIIVAGAIIPPAANSTFNWEGVIGTGYMTITDEFCIPAGTTPGLDVTTVRITAPVFFGEFDYIYFDNVAGIWDPQ